MITPKQTKASIDKFLLFYDIRQIKFAFSGDAVFFSSYSFECTQNTELFTIPLVLIFTLWRIILPEIDLRLTIISELRTDIISLTKPFFIRSGFCWLPKSGSYQMGGLYNWHKKIVKTCVFLLHCRASLINIYWIHGSLNHK